MRIVPVLLVLTGLASPVYGQVAGGSFAYARLGSGAVLAGNARPASAIGFGFRGELDSVAVDFSFLNFILAGGRNVTGDGAFAGSLFRLQVLRFLAPEADRSIYVGGGMSYARVTSGISRKDEPLPGYESRD